LNKIVALGVFKIWAELPGHWPERLKRGGKILFNRMVSSYKYREILNWEWEFPDSSDSTSETNNDSEWEDNA
jgi:hypothetical protein